VNLFLFLASKKKKELNDDVKGDERREEISCHFKSIFLGVFIISIRCAVLDV